MELLEVKTGILEGKIVWIKVTKKDKEGNTKKVNIKIGAEYIVNPLNPRKLKHRNRVGIVRSFKEFGSNRKLKVHLKFSDNNNFGWVDPGDLEILEKIK